MCNIPSVMRAAGEQSRFNGKVNDTEENEALVVK